MNPPFNWTAGYASQRSPVFARNVVSTSHPLAAQAGLRMLLRGGNAVDAAIATAAVMTIVEPCSNGLGSDAFCILWDGQQLQGLNASGVRAGRPGHRTTSRASTAPTRRRRPSAAGTRSPCPAPWPAGWRCMGASALPFADLLAPAIEIAERGYAVPVIVQHKWQNAAALPEITTQPGFAAAFLPRGRAPEVGERFTLAGRRTHAAPDRPDQGRSLLLRRSGRRSRSARRRTAA
jgi:gamma-glutamyltranspeptidase/glutathione hydrolase